jgi:hypothetical protein
MLIGVKSCNGILGREKIFLKIEISRVFILEFLERVVYNIHGFKPCIQRH